MTLQEFKRRFGKATIETLDEGWWGTSTLCRWEEVIAKTCDKDVTVTYNTYRAPKCWTVRTGWGKVNRFSTFPEVLSVL